MTWLAYVRRFIHCRRVGHDACVSREDGVLIGIGCRCGRWFWIRPVHVG